MLSIVLYIGGFSREIVYRAGVLGRLVSETCKEVLISGSLVKTLLWCMSDLDMMFKWVQESQCSAGVEDFEGRIKNAGFCVLLSCFISACFRAAGGLVEVS